VPEPPACQVAADDEASDEAAMAKLSLDELWGFLAHGASAARLPSRRPIVFVCTCPESKFRTASPTLANSLLQGIHL
jgi:hypothetical protein